MINIEQESYSVILHPKIIEPIHIRQHHETQIVMNDNHLLFDDNWETSSCFGVIICWW